MTKNQSSNWIKAFRIDPHPEGGFSQNLFLKNHAEIYEFKDGYEKRSLYTSIYFFIKPENPSQFSSFKIWWSLVIFNAGNPLTVHML